MTVLAAVSGDQEFEVIRSLIQLVVILVGVLVGARVREGKRK